MRKQKITTILLTQGVKGWTLTRQLESPEPEAKVQALQALLQVFGQQNRLILKHPEFKGAVGPLSKYVCPPTAYEKDSSEHRAPRATQLHQVREVPVAQQLLIWENDLSELCRALDSEIRVTTTAFCRKV